MTFEDARRLALQRFEGRLRALFLLVADPKNADWTNEEWEPYQEANDAAYEAAKQLRRINAAEVLAKDLAKGEAP